MLRQYYAMIHIYAIISNIRPKGKTSADGTGLLRELSNYDIG